MRFVILSLLAITWSVNGQIWLTQYDQHFQFICPHGEMIKAIASNHDNHYEDRIWNFTCVYPPHRAALSGCEWSGYVNEFDQLLEYQCPGDKMICGVESVHDNHSEDRKFSFYCCGAKGYASHSCELTPYENTYDHLLNYRVPDNYILKGVNSVHDNHSEDRIFKFDICKLDHIPGVVVG